MKEYEEFLLMLKELREAVDPLSAPDTFGVYPKLSLKEISDLRKRYNEVFEKASAYLGAVTDENREAEKENIRLCDQVQAMLMKDIRGLEMASEGMGFPEIIHNARTRKVDVSGKKLNTVGNLLSSRIPIYMTGENGKPVKGFFTKRTSLSVEKFKAEFVAEFPELESVFDDMLRGAENDKFDSKKKAKELFKSLCKKHAGLEAKKKQFSAAGKRCKEYQDTKNQYLGLIFDQSSGDIDTRNIAMSEVAALIGADGVLAKSTPLTIVNKGKEIEGTFMLNAEGIDAAHIKKGSPIERLTDTGFDNSPVLKDMADITVLDYICGNNDRHLGNMFYKIDSSNPKNPKITGITGIDNDMSFGSNDIFVPNNRHSGLSAINFMSASMAERIRSLDENVLRHRLDGLGLGNDNIEPAIKRLREVKAKIDTPELKIIKDANFAKCKLKDFIVSNEKNAFSEAKKLIIKIKKKNYEAEEVNEKKTVEKPLNMFEKADGSIVSQDMGPLNQLHDKLELATINVHLGSGAFDAVLKDLKILKLLSAKLEDNNGIVNKADLIQLRTAYNNTVKDCKKYIKRKIDDKTIDSDITTKPGKRIAAVKAVMEFCGNKSVMLENVINPKTAADEIRDMKAEADALVISSMKPRDAGNFIKSMNEMMIQQGSNLEVCSKIASQLETMVKYIKTNNPTLEALGINQNDLNLMKDNILAGRKANAELMANEQSKEGSHKENKAPEISKIDSVL